MGWVRLGQGKGRLVELIEIILYLFYHSWDLLSSLLSVNESAHRTKMLGALAHAVTSKRVAPNSSDKAPSQPDDKPSASATPNEKTQRPPGRIRAASQRMRKALSDRVNARFPASKFGSGEPPKS